MTNLYRLVYVSTASPELVQDDIAAILDTSVSNNYERFITGILIHARGHFLQVLEGNEQEVMEIYKRIVRDPRHSCVIQIQGRRGVDRMFPEWSMNYEKLELNDIRLRQRSPIGSLLPETLSLQLSALIEDFAEVQ
ncbi:MAG: BLUF domain-containing protein [Pseudomonadota bacterium]